MELKKIFSVDFVNIANDNLLRNDFKFHQVNNVLAWNIFNSKSDNLIPLKEILYLDRENFDYKDDTDYKGIPTGREYLDEQGEIISFKLVNKENHPGRLKYKANQKHILLSSLRGARTPALNFDYDISDYVFSNGFYIFKVKQAWNLKFILYLLRTDKIKKLIDYHIYRGIGISSYKYDDLFKIQIPKIAKTIQDKIVDKIISIESEISQLKQKINTPEKAINEVFAKEFGIDTNKFEQLKEIKKINTEFIDIASNIDIRYSYKFHNKANTYITKLLENYTDKRIKDFVQEPIVLGKGISPKEYDEDGNYYYLAMSSIKTWAFEKEGCKKTTEEFAKNNQHKTIQKGDILMARSGEGTIGKVALITDNTDGIFADFTMRIRFTDFEPQLAYYYFRSEYFQYLVYSHKKGLGNNTNIFPSQIREFPMPDWDTKKQKKITKTIKIQLDKQEQYKNLILNKQQEINRLIEKTITQQPYHIADHESCENLK